MPYCLLYVQLLLLVTMIQELEYKVTQTALSAKEKDIARRVRCLDLKLRIGIVSFVNLARFSICKVAMVHHFVEV